MVEAKFAVNSVKNHMYYTSFKIMRKGLPEDLVSRNNSRWPFFRAARSSVSEANSNRVIHLNKLATLHYAGGIRSPLICREMIVYEID